MTQDFSSLGSVQSTLGSVDCLGAHFTRHRFMPHMHEEFVVGAVTAGTFQTRYRGATSYIRTGDVFVFAPGEMHTGEPSTEDGYAYCAFYPAADMIRSIAGADAGWLPTFRQAAMADRDLVTRLDAAYRSSRVPEEVMRAEVMLLEALQVLLKRHAAVSVAEAPAAPRGIRDVREYIEANYDRPLTLATLAAVAGSGVFHLVRSFRKHVGVPPYTYLELVRVRRACEMLQPGRSISQIAYATGFSDQSHLNRRFRKVVGVTPGQYARNRGRHTAAVTARSSSWP